MNHIKLFEQFNNDGLSEWFGDSKVVDSDGNPLLVYHGTANKFDTFDKSKIGDNYIYSEDSGFFFTIKEQSAKNYARLHSGGFNDPDKKGYVMSAYLKIVNPLYIKTNSESYPPADYFDKNRGDIMEEVNQSDTREDWGDLYEHERFDGIIIKGTRNDDLYIVFEPEQIKIIK